MTDMPNLAGSAVVSNEFQAPASRQNVDDTYWGYTIQSQGRTNVLMVLAQTTSLFLGAAFLAAALGLVLLPNMIVGAEDLMFRMVAAILFCAVAFFFLWFSSRGTNAEVQVDTNLGEVREVVRNRAGKATLLGRYGFDAIGGVFIDRQERRDGQSALVLRYRNTAQTLLVAVGPEAELEALRDRLGRDLMLGGTTRREAALPQGILRRS